MITIIDPKIGINGENQRSEILPDDRFTIWVEDIYRPPSWAVYFGLVRVGIRSVVLTMEDHERIV